MVIDFIQFTLQLLLAGILLRYISYTYPDTTAGKLILFAY